MLYKSILLPREKDASIMEALVAAGIRGDLLEELNKCRKHQEAFFVSNIPMANGQRIKSNCITDWEDSYESDLGKHQSRYQYGTDHPIKGNWKQWEFGLSRLPSQTATSSSP